MVKNKMAVTATSLLLAKFFELVLAHTIVIRDALA